MPGPDVIDRETLGVQLQRWEADARLLTVCVECGGSGADRWAEGRACATCGGRGRAPGQPHVLQLIALVRQLDRDEAAHRERAAVAVRLADAAEATVDRLVGERDDLRWEFDQARGQLYQARADVERARQQGFDAGRSSVIDYVQSRIDGRASVTDLRHELAAMGATK